MQPLVNETCRVTVSGRYIRYFISGVRKINFSCALLIVNINTKFGIECWTILIRGLICQRMKYNPQINESVTGPMAVPVTCTHL